MLGTSVAAWNPRRLQGGRSVIWSLLYNFASKHAGDKTHLWSRALCNQNNRFAIGVAFKNTHSTSSAGFQATKFSGCRFQSSDISETYAGCQVGVLKLISSCGMVYLERVCLAYMCMYMYMYMYMHIYTCKYK